VDLRSGLPGTRETPAGPADREVPTLQLPGHFTGGLNAEADHRDGDPLRDRVTGESSVYGWKSTL
jgi:hypothetical protein